MSKISVRRGKNSIIIEIPLDYLNSEKVDQNNRRGKFNFEFAGAVLYISGALLAAIFLYIFAWDNK